MHINFKVVNKKKGRAGDISERLEQRCITAKPEVISELPAKVRFSETPPPRSLAKDPFETPSEHQRYTDANGWRGEDLLSALIWV